MKNLMSFLFVAVLLLSATLFQVEKANADSLLLLSLCERGEKNYDAVYGGALFLKAFDLPWMMPYGAFGYPQYEQGVYNSQHFHLEPTPRKRRK